MKSFSELELIPEIQTALKENGYKQPTPIQAAAIPIVLRGEDLLGIAQTGTGKTAAFLLPMIQLLTKNRVKREHKCPRALILTPTRELAIQIHDNLKVYSKFLKLTSACIFGGVGQGQQVQALQYGTDVLVATPGRLLDLIDQRYLKLDRVEIFVLDEADRMLDMGFMKDIKKIVPMLPIKRHNLFFSATMPPEIAGLARNILHLPKKVEVTPPATTAEKVKQSAMIVSREDKLKLLIHLLKQNGFEKTLVFVEMKHLADRVAKTLQAEKIKVAAIHGDKSQGARQRAINDFADDKVEVLVATDIAARGIDIDGITHVINYDLSHLPESYVHRIGRTARAGKEGEAISLITGLEKSYLYNIEKVTRQKIEIILEHPFRSEQEENTPVMSAGKAKAILEAERDARKKTKGHMARKNHQRPSKRKRN